MAKIDLIQEIKLFDMSRMLARILSDTRGNALMITAIAIFPILAMIGSGVDISRAYMVKGRLQQACDSSALAIRRSMLGNNLTLADRTEGRKFFNFNFPKGSLNTNNLTYSAQLLQGTNEISIYAATKMPNMVMMAFGFEDQEISVNCKAAQGFVNNDIVMVLDTSGSMEEYVGSDVKIEALRSAIISFYDALKPAQTALEAKGLRLRYSFVSYSAHVNVGRLIYDINESYIRNPSPFRTEETSESQIADVTRDKVWMRNSWNGCIDERDTDPNFDEADGYAIPAAAFDLQLDTMPNPADRRTLWRFMDPDSQPGRRHDDAVCPSPSVRLKAWTRQEIKDYSNTLIPAGGTYHDIGMIWGGRMLSNAGIFADSPDDYNGYPTNRYLIFMTDGELAPRIDTYSAYGIERYDHRVVGSADYGYLYDRHLHRFQALCNAIKGKNVSIWTIAFDVLLSPDLRRCASDPDQASAAADKNELIKAFQKISRSVGGLRLTQ